MAGHHWRLATSKLEIQNLASGNPDIVAIEAAANVGVLVNQVSVSFSEEGSDTGNALVQLCFITDDGTGGSVLTFSSVGGDSETFQVTAQEHNGTVPGDGWSGAQPAGAVPFESRSWPIDSQASCQWDFVPPYEIKGGDGLLVRVTGAAAVADTYVVVTLTGEE
jgi:hypothetical protein